MSSRPVTFDNRVWIAIGTTVIAFASAFAAGRAALRGGYSPEHITVLRFLIASACLIVIALIQRMPLPRWRDLPILTLMGILGFSLYGILLNNGQRTVSAGASSLIVNISPVLVALLAWVLYRERLTGWAWMGFLLSLSGVALIGAGREGGLTFSEGVLPLLGAALCLASYSALQKRLLGRYTPLQFLTYAIWLSTLTLLIFLPGLPEAMTRAPLGATFAIIYLAVVTSIIGYGSWSYVLSRLPASRAGVFLYLNPAVAFVIAWLWLGEVPGVWTILGGVLVLAGVILVNTKGRARIVPEPGS